MGGCRGGRVTCTHNLHPSPSSVSPFLSIFSQNVLPSFLSFLPFSRSHTRAAWTSHLSPTSEKQHLQRAPFIPSAVSPRIHRLFLCYLFYPLPSHLPAVLPCMGTEGPRPNASYPRHRCCADSTSPLDRPSCRGCYLCRSEWRSVPGSCVAMASDAGWLYGRRGRGR